jgi:MOSC domain-containing protein
MRRPAEAASPQFGGGAEGSGRLPAVPRVARINVTPVKSMALQHPDEVMLEDIGVREDRLFYLVAPDAELVSAIQHGSLLTIRPRYEPGTERLALEFPDGRSIEGDASELVETIETDFYGRPVPARIVQGPWAAALSAFLGRPVRLARCDRPGDGTDVHHVTLVSRESVAELARRGGHDGELDARRFRMTIELAGCEPHEEDAWDGDRVRIGDAVVRIHGQVPRCLVTTKNPVTGTKDFETLKVIAAYRPLMGPKRRLPFGVYAEVDQKGRLRVGDPVELAV